ncbi:MAG: hypothetical protein WC088_03420 [Candidatus Izemoplasmatales bacterium]|jgi:hypothetical protein|nr:hypothetical protein [Candidatus Izemoplasmatales bacterium]MDD4595335.1 hypothetical protein [Candidatus Izemoplasmatales bacterium]
MAKDQLKEERMKILELLAKGTISAEDAEKLLSAMGDNEKTEGSVVLGKKMPFRMLKIYVDSADGDVVKIEIPIEFAKLLKSGKFNIDQLGDMDIDIDDLISMINSGAVGELINVKSADGDVVRIAVE